MTTEQMTKTSRRLLELAEKGLTQTQIAAAMNTEGFKTRGGSEWTQTHVSTAMRGMGLIKQKRLKKKKTKVNKARSSVVARMTQKDERDALADLVWNSKCLANEEKKQILQVLW